MARLLQRAGAADTDRIVMWSVRAWWLAAPLVMPAALLACLAPPVALLRLDLAGGAAAVLLAAVCLLGWSMLLAYWRSNLFVRLHRAILHRSQMRLSGLASREPGVLRLHDWTDEGPGAIALSRERLWLCCAATEFRPLILSPQAIETLHVYRFTRPIVLGLMFRECRARGTITIPFPSGEIEARDWCLALNAFAARAAQR